MVSRDPRVNPAVANPDVRLKGVQYERNPEAEYGEHIRNVGCICNTSASHTYGNVMGIIEKFLLTEVFPADLFKTVTASTALVTRQLNHTPSQLSKQELPLMVLAPRIVYGQEENRFLGHTLINDRITNTHAYWGDGSLLPLAEDPLNHLWIHGHYNRAVMYIDVVLNFNTWAEQQNWMHYLTNMIPIQHNFFIQTPLELYIPDGFCQLISNIVKIPVRDENGSIHRFMSYMNTIWHNPITHMLKGGSNSNEFFMYYLTDIDTIIQEPQPGPGVKDGQVRRGFDISFTIRCDFNTIGYFTLTHPDMKKQVYIAPKDDPSIVPIFTDVIDLNDFDLPIGWQVLSWPIFKLKMEENSISIASLLNKSLNAVIDYHLKFGIPMEKFIRFQFRENGEILNNELFYIDWARRELHLIKPNWRRTYRMIITVSTEYINNLVKELYNLE